MVVNLGRTTLNNSLIQGLLTPYTSLLAGQPDPTMDPMAGIMEQLAGMAPQGATGAAGVGTQTDPSASYGGTGNLITRNGVTMVAPAIRSLIAVQRDAGTRILPHVVSSWRSRAEQAQLYRSYLNGNGNLAAPPGHSNHETGHALDIDSGWLDNHPEVVRALRQAGWGTPVDGEPWHWEPLFLG